MRGGALLGHCEGATDGAHAGICPRSHSEQNLEGCHELAYLSAHFGTFCVKAAVMGAFEGWW